MPVRGSSCSSASDRNCLACDGKTRIAHLGIDLCRACATFYRRREKRHPRSCHSCTEEIAPTRGRACKECRFVKIERMLNPNIVVGKPTSAAKSDELSCQPRVSIALDEYAEGQLMQRLRAQYRSMCHTRLVAELHARGDSSHPLGISSEDCPIYPAVYNSKQSGMQILLSSALEFANVVFPEFVEMEKQEKWDILIEFFYRFRTFDGCYRANVRFPDLPNRFLPNITTFLGPEVYASYFDDVLTRVDATGAAGYLRTSKFKVVDTVALRAAIARVNPSTEEFLTVVGLMFWTLDGLSVSAQVSALSERYRLDLLKELHNFYKKKMKLEEYAVRLGELLMLIQLFDVKEQFKQHFEMLRLLNIFDDNTFAYRLHREPLLTH